MNTQKIEQGVRLLLEGIGEDPNREGLLETPARVARACEELFAGCLLYTSPSPRDVEESRMPSSA